MTQHDPATIANRFADLLTAWRPADPGQADLAAEYLRFIEGSGAAAIERDAGRQHLTASAFVLSPDLERVLLCFHRKGGFWVQLGGHLEPSDASLQEAALREAREEGGIVDLTPISTAPLDLDRHDLGPGFARCDTHWDVGFGFTAAAAAVPVVSEESLAVRWWPVDDLPTEAPPGLEQRVRRAVGAARLIARARTVGPTSSRSEEAPPWPTSPRRSPAARPRRRRR